MKIDVYGREIEVVRRGDLWQVFYIGNEGKRRKANDIVIPSDVPENQIIEYISDLCHEWASQRFPKVKML